MYTAAVESGPRAFLTDFGLAKSVTTGSKFTRTGVTLGTPAYMSPEQARGDLADLSPATDVWGLGCVLYETIAGRRAFDGPTPAEALGQILLSEPPRLDRLRPDAPRDLARLVRACVAKPPARRPRAGAALRDDLDRVLAGRRPSAGAPAPMGRLAAGAALAAAAAGGAAVLWPGESLPGAGSSPSRAAPPEDPTSRARREAEALAERALAPGSVQSGEAAALLGRALAGDPGNPSANAWRLVRGLRLWGIGDGAGAQEEWVRIAGEAPEFPAARLYLGFEAFDRGRPGEARAEIEAAAAGEGVHALLAGATDALASGQWSRARDLLRDAPGWEGAWLRAQLESQDPAGDRAAAVREYGQVLLGGYLLLPVLANRGAIRGQLGDFAGALQDCEAGLRLRPGDPGILRNRASARQRLGDNRGAIEDIETALAADPDVDHGHYIRATAREALGDYPGAEADCDEDLRRRPGRADTWNQRGVVRIRLGRYADAIADLDQALALRPDHVEAYSNRGWARRELEDLPGALADYDAALRIEPCHAIARNNRGNVRRQRGDLDGALEDLEIARRLAPDDPGVHANLGLLHNARGDLRAAAAELAEFLRLAPGHPLAEDFRRFLGRIEAKLREEASAGR